MDQRQLDDLTRKAEELGRQKASHISGKVADLRAQIEILNDEKHEVERAPMSRDEVKLRAKSALQAGREKILIDALAGHLRECQVGAAGFFGPDNLRRGIGEEGRIWKMIFGVVDETMIDRAAEKLTEDGISEPDRRKKIQKIDARIGELGKEIEKILSA